MTGEVTQELRAAVAAHRAGDLGRAEALYEAVLARAPDSAEALNLLGALAGQRGELARARELLERAVALRPGAAALQANLANLYRLQGLLDEAGARLEAALGLAPESPEVHHALGNLRRDEGRLDEAAGHFEAVLERAPNHADALAGLAGVEALRGRPDQAVAHFRQLAAARPKDPRPLAAIAEILQEARRLPEAIAQYRRAIDLAPRDPRNWIGLASCLMEHVPNHYDAELAELLRRCLTMPGLRHQDLAPAAASQVKHRHGLDGEPGDPVPEPTAARRAALAEDGLLEALLHQAINVDPRLETVLTALRRALLPALAEGGPAALAERRLAIALAMQGHNNHYVFWTSAEENRTVDALAPALAAGERDLAFLLTALYRAPFAQAPLRAAIEREGLEAFPEDLRPLARRSLLEPLEQARVGAGLARATAIGDETSRQVRAQYEESPYPRWLAVPQMAPVSLARQLAQDFPHFAPPPRLAGPLEILVAGAGTGRHPIALALSLSNVEVLAVDLSVTSLAYGAWMAARLGIANVTFQQGDILELGTIGRRFPVIQCSGVLHHLAEPLAGWRVLADLLEPGGVMKVGLYSERARRLVAAARRRSAAAGLGSAPEEIRAVRREILTGRQPEDRDLRQRWWDFYDLHSCRDLLFHVQEHRFRPLQLEDMLAELGLSFIGFAPGDPAAAGLYRAAFPEDPAMTDLARWERLEERHPDLFATMYQFWCQKPGGR